LPIIGLGVASHGGIKSEEREKLHFALNILEKPREKSGKEEN